MTLMIKIQINDKYEYMRAFVESIPEIFEHTGEILYDKASKDTECVAYEESIEDYMAREVLPHVPDAKAFWEEKVDAKKPVIKTGAEIPFTQYFYKYEQPVHSEELAKQFTELEQSVSQRIAKLFG